MNPILSSLQDGPKRYGELREIVPPPFLDHQLKALMRNRQIRHTYDTFGVCRFALPEPRDEDAPKQKKIARKTCRACHGLMLLKYFTYNGASHHICEPCHDAQRNPRLAARPTCVICNKRRALRYFVKEGRSYLECEDCRVRGI